MSTTSRWGLVCCSSAVIAANAAATRSTAATPAASGRFRPSRVLDPSRTAAERHSLATPTRTGPVSRLRPSCELPASVFLDRRTPSGESPGSLGLGSAPRSRRVAAAVTIDCCSSAWGGPSCLDHPSRLPDGPGLSSGAAGRYQPRFRLLSGRSALLDGSAVARSEVPSASVGRPPRRTSRAPLRPSPVLLPFPSGDSI